MVMVFMLAAATVLGACGKSDKKTEATAAPVVAAATPAPAADGKKLYIPVISKGFQHQFWQAVKQGAEKAAKEFNVDITFEGPDTEAQVDKQIEMLQAALGKKASAIAFAALDSKAATPLLEQAKAAGIPIVGFDSGVDSDIPVTTAATDNVAAAALAADKMAELIGSEGEVGLIVHDQTSRTGVDRRDGFMNRMKEKYPNIKILNPEYAGGDQLKSTDAAKAMIQSHPNLKGIFGTNEGSAIGVVNAITELKKDGKIVIIGFDSGKAQIDAVRSGQMSGAITQNPIGIGYEAVKAAVQAVKGETVAKTIDTGFYWYDKTNVDEQKIKDVLYN
ncbi:BMP family ABC transporter substrate-binding protein [Paenibacillus psychroresistens]|uniref:BMP family ABC transporter substrate-binding protein n=2 Tax=Paenibacillus psychroresistens TaxID=1778678 RepID=A0A6B8RYH5_9BACL|nr:ABC transporter substrate-binding protein [Paenibacillus psychroresistens]QGR00324.1 BMP family ABC transporter substrate-binding protein [Paenibacillus psychroresistens]